ncbi:MAG TPA: hypothetical protein VGD65_22395 [Chryseosolibacter sp.]
MKNLQAKTVVVSVPRHVELLCELLGVGSQELMQEFANTLLFDHSTSSSKNNLLNDFILSKGYGREKFCEREILQALADLRTVVGLFPSENEDENEEWRDKLLEYWFEQWNARQKEN